MADGDSRFYVLGAFFTEKSGAKSGSCSLASASQSI